MRNIVLTAGRARRMDGLAPYGCKALTPYRGRPMIEWQLDVLGDVTIVTRGEHAELLEPYGDIVVCDEGGGPVGALRAVDVDEPVTVVYADSWFSELPGGSDWVGVGRGTHGRAWDVIDEVTGYVHYGYLNRYQGPRVCVGIYRFSNPNWLNAAVEFVWSRRQGEVGMGAVLNCHAKPNYVDIPSWVDVGTRAALEAA